MRKANHILVFISKSVASRSSEVILPFCLSCISLKTIHMWKTLTYWSTFSRWLPRQVSTGSHNVQRKTQNWICSSWSCSGKSLLLPTTPYNRRMLWRRIQTLLRGTQWKEGRQWAQVGTQEILTQSKGESFSLWGWSKNSRSCPETLWKLHPWRYSKLNWTRWINLIKMGLLWAEVWTRDLWKSLLMYITLWFYAVLCAFIIYSRPFKFPMYFESLKSCEKTFTNVLRRNAYFWPFVFIRKSFSFSCAC